MIIEQLVIEQHPLKGEVTLRAIVIEPVHGFSHRIGLTAPLSVAQMDSLSQLVTDILAKNKAYLPDKTSEK